MNWEKRPLKGIGQWFGGATPSKSRPEFWDNGSIPWLSPKDMGPPVLAGTEDHITPAAVAGSPVRPVPANSVAIVVRSGILDRTLPVAIVPFETTLNQDMKAVTPNHDVDARWIAWGLRAFENHLLRTTRKTGTTVASIEMPRFHAFELPVPSLAEQRRILEILEDHLSRLDAAADSLAANQKRCESMRTASLRRILAEASTSNPDVRTVGELASVGSGTTPSRSKSAYFDGGTIPWVTSGDLSKGLIESASQYVTKAALEQTSLRKYPMGTLLIAMYGEGKTRGTVAELGIEATINQACAAVQLHDPEKREWVRAVLEANYSVMRRLAAGGVQPNLNLSLVRSIEIPVPNREVRDQLLGDNHVANEAQRALRDSLSQTQTRATSLRRAVLAAAFSGKLNGRDSDTEAIQELADVRASWPEEMVSA
jgi:type I restriction enzyme S subunit